jgi:hypothetical protein
MLRMSAFEFHRRGWVPPDKVEGDAQTSVSGLNYAEQATALHIGDGWIGLHVSSYGIQREGSGQAVAGGMFFSYSIRKQGRSIPPGYR